MEGNISTWKFGKAKCEREEVEKKIQGRRKNDGRFGRSVHLVLGENSNLRFGLGGPKAVVIVRNEEHEDVRK